MKRLMNIVLLLILSSTFLSACDVFRCSVSVGGYKVHVDRDSRTEVVDITNGKIVTVDTDAFCRSNKTYGYDSDLLMSTNIIDQVRYCYFGGNRSKQITKQTIVYPCPSDHKPNFVDPNESVALVNTTVSIWQSEGNIYVTDDILSGDRVLLIGSDVNLHYVQDRFGRNQSVPVGSVSFSIP